MTNVVLLVWDACRLDIAQSHAPNLAKLAEDNLWFENAIAPGDWSHPSHASIFTGEYPANHGTCAPVDPMAKPVLVEHLKESGYSTFGVSANLFAGVKKDFDEPFDEFVNTFPFSEGNPPSSDGIDITELSRNNPHESAARRYASHLGTALKNPYTISSLYNLSIATGRKLARDRDWLQKKSPLFHQNNLFAYDPNHNTSSIETFLEEVGDTDESFFVFANYADTHRPYNPPGEFQEAFSGYRRSFKRIEYLNEEVANEWAFLEKVADGTLAEDELEEVRELYAAEVRSVDTHLQRLLTMLEDCGLRDDTMVIVTADHGENLGEVDERGERRMCHMESVSDHLLNVPLVIAHPNLDGAVVEDPVSLKSLYDVIKDGGETLHNAANPERVLVPDDGIVLADCPARFKRSNILERYPGVPPEIIEQERRGHKVVAYTDDWKVVLTSDENGFARRGGEKRSLDSAPDKVVRKCRDHLERLPAIESYETKEDVDEESREHLKQLGYL